MKVVFMGSAKFAVPSLESLFGKHEILCVYSQPPRRGGRGLKLQATPIHAKAESLGLSVRTPVDLRGESKFLQSLQADILVVVAYGLLIPQEVLDIFKFGGVNVHPSLLPRWRGAAPIERSIEAGDDETGVSIISMTDKLDEGDILLQRRLFLTESMSSDFLHEEFSFIGSELLLQVLDGGKFVGIKQSSAGVSYARKWLKSDGLLDFSLGADVLACKVRAASSVGGCYFMVGGVRVKVWRAEVSDEVSDWSYICGDGYRLRLLEVQESGKGRQVV